MHEPLRSFCERAICGTAMDNFGRLVTYEYSHPKEICGRNDVHIRAGSSQ